MSPSKTSAEIKNTKGNIKETVGGTLGLHSMENSGRREQAEAEAEINASKAEGYAKGTGDRVHGKFDSVVGGVTGDSSQEAKGNVRQEKGDARQEFNRKY